MAKNKLTTDGDAIYQQMAYSLADQYASIYYVDCEDDSYIEFASTDVYKSLGVAPVGQDFFGETKRNNEHNIHPDDRELLRVVEDKQKLMDRLEQEGSYTVTYRLLMGNRPVYARLHAVLSADGRHIIIGVADVDEQMRRELQAKRAVEDSMRFSQIAYSLADSYTSLYYVNAQNYSYVEFHASARYRELNIPSSGDNFFDEYRRYALHIVHPDDIGKVLKVLDGDRMVAALDRGESVSATYRLMIEGEPVYVDLKGAWASDHEHIVVSIMNVDKQVRIEKAHKHDRAQNLMYAQVTSKLADSYDSIYYVSLEDDSYVDFSQSAGMLGRLRASECTDFSAKFEEAVREHLHPEDNAVLDELLNKSAVVTKLRSKSKTVSATLRLVENGEVTHHRVTVMLTDDRAHLIVGITNADDQIRSEAAAREAEERSRFYGNIAKSLSSQYATIYFVDVYTKHYTEFTSSDIYKGLNVPPSGSDFFRESRHNIMRVIHPEDTDKLIAYMDRDRMTEEVSKNGYLSLTYRLRIGEDGDYVWANMNVAWADDHRHLIVGVADVNDRMKQEEERREEAERQQVYSYIAQSLANQYATIYYVDVYTETYIEFSSSNTYKELNVAPSGDDFFGTSRKNIQDVVHPDDIAALEYLMDRDRMTEAINENGSVSITYRLLMGGAEVYTNLRAVWADDLRHLIIGLTDVDAATRHEMARREAEKRVTTYANIAQSLAERYDAIHYVDAETSAYSVYSSTADYQSLNAPESGEDFFADCEADVRRLIFREDMDFVLNALTRENVMRELEKYGQMSISYRLMLDGKPAYVNLRLVWAEDHKHFIVALSNVDAEMAREKEHERNLSKARELALRDELTGVKNKNAYRNTEAELAENIAAGTQAPFAIVVCDVNGLKQVNDTQGHQAGDAYIQSACALICSIYAHSPVFRIGGDEFAVVLSGQDYNNRNMLLGILQSEVLKNQDRGEVIVASGMSAYEKGLDMSPNDVFMRADETMYANKKTLKGARQD